VSGETVTLLDWPAGTYVVEWLDPRTGAVVAKTEATGTAGQLRLALPAFAEDLAAIVTPVP